MKRFSSLLAMALLFVAAVPLFAEWQGEVRITKTSKYSTITESGGWGIIADTNDVYIVWDDQTYIARIRYVSFPIGNPPAPGAGTALTISFAYSPSVATNGNGVIEVAWMDGTSTPYTLRRREYYDGSWSGIKEFGYSGYWNHHPAIAVGRGYTFPYPKMHAVFHRYEPSGPYYYRVCYQRAGTHGSGGLDSPKILCTPPYHQVAWYPSICAGSPGQIHVVWLQTWSPRNLGYAYSSNNGESWSTSSISTTKAYCYNEAPPSICVDKSNKLYVAYSDYSNNQICVVKKDGGWSSPIDVSNGSAPCYYPSICCDTFGNIWVVWTDSRNGTWETYYNRLPAGADFATGWEGAVQLTPSDGYRSHRADITADPHGNVHVAWVDARDGNWEIYYDWFCPVSPKDVAVVSIDAPPDTVWVGYAQTPKATVANLKQDTASFNVACAFRLSGTLVYADTVWVSALAGGATEQVAFDGWTPANPGSYAMSVTTLLEGDMNPDNDNLSKAVIAVWPPRDVAVVSIDAPSDTVWAGWTYTPKATVTNLFEHEDATFDVVCKFDSSATTVYLDTVEVTDLAFGVTREVSFAPWIAGIEGGLVYEMTVATILEHDIHPANDTMIKTVTTTLIEASVDFDPDKLNFKSGGKWVTSYIELPDGYSVQEIDTSTVAIFRINGEYINPPLFREGPTEIGDHDSDEIADLMVKFDRQTLIDILKSMGYDDGDKVELTVGGRLRDKRPFAGEDSVEIVNKGKGGGQSGEVTAIPTSFKLYPSSPNPFSAAATLRYDLPVETPVRLEIYNPIGQRVATLVDEVKKAGSYTLVWNGTDDRARKLASGVYVAKLSAGEYKETTRILVSR